MAASRREWPFGETTFTSAAGGEDRPSSSGHRVSFWRTWASAWRATHTPQELVGLQETCLQGGGRGGDQRSLEVFRGREGERRVTGDEMGKTHLQRQLLRHTRKAHEVGNVQADAPSTVNLRKRWRV